jgi:hypothetical protein
MENRFMSIQDYLELLDHFRKIIKKMYQKTEVKAEFIKQLTHLKELID